MKIKYCEARDIWNICTLQNRTSVCVHFFEIWAQREVCQCCVAISVKYIYIVIGKDIEVCKYWAINYCQGLERSVCYWEFQWSSLIVAINRNGCFTHSISRNVLQEEWLKYCAVGKIKHLYRVAIAWKRFKLGQGMTIYNLDIVVWATTYTLPKSVISYFI